MPWVFRLNKQERAHRSTSLTALSLPKGGIKKHAVMATSGGEVFAVNPSGGQGIGNGE